MAFRQVLFLILIFTLTFNISSEDIKDNNMSKGVQMYQKGRYIDAVFYLNLVLEEKNELYSEALFWKAKSHFELKHYNDSKDALELLFRKGSIVTPYYEDARFLYCKIFFKLKNYKDAILLLNQFRRNPGFTYYNDAALFWLGESYLQLSDLSQARENYSKYIELKPKSVLAKERLILVDRMISLLSAAGDTEVSVVEKAGWLTDYVIKEVKEKKVDLEERSVSKLLDQFKTQEQFFYWLEQKYINVSEEKESEDLEEVEPAAEVVEEDSAIEEPVVDIEPDSTTIKVEEKDLNELEKEILEELEKKLIDVLGEEP